MPVCRLGLCVKRCEELLENVAVLEDNELNEAKREKAGFIMELLARVCNSERIAATQISLGVLETVLIPSTLF